MPFQPKPFNVSIPQADLDDLKARIKGSRLPVPTFETSHDGTDFGVSGKYVRESIDYWANGYDWRKVESRINKLPHFKAEIEDNGHNFDLHYIEIKSKDPKAIPLLLLHGWPGSFLEFLEAAPLLAASTSPAFHIVIPSLPGYAFSAQPPTDRDMGLREMASVTNKLMLELGYKEYAAQGGDLGAFVASILGRNDFPACKAYHTNLAVVGTDGFDMTTLDEVGRKGVERGNQFLTTGVAYADLHGQRTSTISHVLASSPPRFNEWSDKKPTLDQILDSVTLYWVTHTIERALYPYRQIRAANADLSPKGDKPFGYSFSPMEIVPRTGALVKHSCPNLEWYRDHTSGGHFWALEKPEEVAKDLADCFGQIWPREQ